jgi:CRP-like cAMP-binding protein
MWERLVTASGATGAVRGWSAGRIQTGDDAAAPAPRLASRPMGSVIRRLRALARLSEADLELLLRLRERRTRHRPGEALITEGEPSPRARFIASGWASSQRVLSDGRRQIFGLLLPGDGLGLRPRRQAPAPCSVLAATALETVDAEPVLEAVREGRSPGLALALTAAACAEDLATLDHMTRLGAQTAYERVAHLLLELQHRLEMVDLGDSERFPLPLTQDQLADHLGLSVVHINRTLQQLRRDKLIELRGGVAVLLQRERLVALADFRRPGAPQASTRASA